MKLGEENTAAAIFLALLVLVAVITNPDGRVHRAKVRDLFLSKRGAGKDWLAPVSPADELESAGSALGYSLGISAIDKMLESIVAVDNYVLFSVSKIRHAGEEMPIAVGAFGNVFPFDGPLKNHSWLSSDSYTPEKIGQRTKASQATDSYLVTPFDRVQVRLPQSFKGHDFDNIIAALISRRKKVEAYDEFETTQQRKERIKRVQSSPVIGDLTPQSLYAFQSYPLGIDDDDCWYDSDEEGLFTFFAFSEVMTNALEGLSLRESSLKPMRQIFLAGSKTLYEGQRIGRYPLFRRSIDRYLVCVNPTQFPPSVDHPRKYGKGLLAKLQLQSDQARQLKPNLHALFVCKLVSPFASEDVIRSKPDRRRPEGITSFFRFLYVSVVEVWLYDLNSGQVHYKMKSVNGST